MKLSFIIPIYNVAPYLRKCVDSLIHQDYCDYEIILVDDGSTDNSPQICDEYVKRVKSEELKDKSMKVLHQKNGGLSAARNAGLNVAEGEYVCFVDSDDYWESNVLGSLMAQVERDKLDVLRFNYQNVRITDSVQCNVYGVQYEVFQPYKRDHRLDNDYSKSVTDGVTFLNTRMNTQCYAVMFIIRRSLLIVESGRSIDKRGKLIENREEIRDNSEECLFTEGIYFEDTDWTPRMLVRAKRVASTDKIVYNYLIRGGSITKAVDRTKQKKVLDDKMRLVGEMKQQAADLQNKGLETEWFDRMIADTVISIVGILSTDFYEERENYLEQLQKMSMYPILGTSFKARLINFSPNFAVTLLHLKNGK